jgi:putative nucleotidyltransferase with HDIG domain
MRLLVKLVISVSVDEFFGHSGLGYSLCKGGLYHHAVGTAIIAEKLSDYTGSVKPGLAYTAGLLHDIGKVVLDQSIASAYPLFYRRLYEEENNVLEAENEILGFNHAQVGHKLDLKRQSDILNWRMWFTWRIYSCPGSTAASSWNG